MEFTRGDILPSGAVVTDVTTATPSTIDVCFICGRAFATGAPVVLTIFADSPEVVLAYDVACLDRDTEPTTVTVTLTDDGRPAVDAPSWVTVDVRRRADGAPSAEADR